MSPIKTPLVHLPGEECIWTKIEDGCRGSYVARVNSIMPEDQAMAQRIVDCVNALEGIELAKHGDLLTKQNAHIYMHKPVRVWSDLTRKWRNEILTPYLYHNFYIGNSDFSRLQLGHLKQDNHE